MIIRQVHYVLECTCMPIQRHIQQYRKYTLHGWITFCISEFCIYHLLYMVCYSRFNVHCNCWPCNPLPSDCFQFVGTRKMAMESGLKHFPTLIHASFKAKDPQIQWHCKIWQGAKKVICLTSFGEMVSYASIITLQSTGLKPHWL